MLPDAPGKETYVSSSQIWLIMILFRRYPTEQNHNQLKVVSNLSKKLLRRDYVAYIDKHISENILVEID